MHARGVVQRGEIRERSEIASMKIFAIPELLGAVPEVKVHMLQALGDVDVHDLRNAAEPIRLALR